MDLCEESGLQDVGGPRIVSRRILEFFGRTNWSGRLESWPSCIVYWGLSQGFFLDLFFRLGEFVSWLPNMLIFFMLGISLVGEPCAHRPAALTVYLYNPCQKESSVFLLSPSHRCMNRMRNCGEDWHTGRAKSEWNWLGEGECNCTIMSTCKPFILLSVYRCLGSNCRLKPRDPSPIRLMELHSPFYFTRLYLEVYWRIQARPRPKRILFWLFWCIPVDALGKYVGG